MSPRLVLALVLAPLLATTAAHAQAPGEWTPSEYQGPSGVQPAYVAPAQPVFHARWSIAASAGKLRLTSADSPDAKTDFQIGELALRYRGWRHLELELSVAGGTQQLSDDQGGGDGDLKIVHTTFAARYRFNVEQHFNWWLMAGFGATTVASKNATDDEVSAAQRPHGLIGIGAEYRWDKFALQAEGKAIAVGPTDDEQMQADANGTETNKISGGSFTLGGAFYF